MTPNTKKERFSLAYISAVAAHTGFQVTEPKVDFDSIDGMILSDEGKRPRLEFQAKATARPDILKDDHLAFPLPVKNYNDLRAETVVPRVLIVVLLPEEETDWVHHSEEELRLRRCGYWLSLSGMKEEDNKAVVTVHVPRSQVFDSGQLTQMMSRIDNGEQP